MTLRYKTEFVDTLRATLSQMETSENLSPDDQPWRQLKRAILLAIAKLEEESEESDAAGSQAA